MPTPFQALRKKKVVYKTNNTPAFMGLVFQWLEIEKGNKQEGYQK